MFDVNNRFWQFLNKMIDQILLTFLWILCSLPIITFGASTAAYFKISMELHQDIEGAMFRDFFREFGRCFRRATLVWLVQMAVWFFLIQDVYLCWLMGNQIGWFLIPVILILGALFWIVCLFTWPLLSHSSVGFKEIWRQAARLMITYLPYGLSCLALIGIGVVIILLVPYITVFIPGPVFYQYSRVFTWMFDKDERLQGLLDLRKARFV